MAMVSPPPGTGSDGASGVEAATSLSVVPQLEQNLFVSRLDEPHVGHILVMNFFLSTLFRRTDETEPARTIIRPVTNGRSPKYTIAHVHSQDSVIVKWTVWRSLAIIVALGIT